MITLFFDEYGEQAQEILEECDFIYSDAEVFLCGYLTNSDYILKKTEKVLDIPNTVYIYYAAGNITNLLGCFKAQQYICFNRLNSDKLRIYNFQKFKDKLWAEKRRKKRHQSHQK